MPRNISFFATKAQVEDESKDITRRLGWADLKPGTILQAVEKGKASRRASLTG